MGPSLPARDEATIEAVETPRFSAFQENKDCDTPIFWNAEGILLVDYLNYHRSLLC